MIKALIFDLDNTIYPVDDIADELFESLFSVVEGYRDFLGNAAMSHIKDEFKRRPYQDIARQYNFSEELNRKGLEHLESITYSKPMTAYDGYDEVSRLPLPKFLVTKGFSKLQYSKIEMLGIADDFEEIHIVDPAKSNLTKNEVFTDILNRYQYLPHEVLVIGDDPLSEIKAAKELGINTFLFDPTDAHPEAEVNHRSGKLLDIIQFIGA